MRRSAWILAAAVTAIASPAAAQGVKLVPGEEVVFTLDGGTPVGAKRASVTPKPFEVAVGRHFSGQKPPEAPVTEGLPIPGSDRLPPGPRARSRQAPLPFPPSARRRSCDAGRR